MTPRSIAAAGIGLSLFGSMAHGADFTLTGQYEGTVACDSTTAGVPWSWGRSITVAIVEGSGTLSAELHYTDTREYGAEYALYRGGSTRSADGTIASGYLRACGGSFPADELVRLFPTGTAARPFNFAADAVWVSDAVPNRPGLTVQSCRYSLTRVSTDTPSVRDCPTR